MDEAQNSKPSRKRASASSSELNEKPEFVLKPKDGENTEKLDERRFYLWGRFNYGIIMQSDIPNENTKRDVLDLCQIACEKYAAAEKSPKERNNQAAATMIKEGLDKKLGGPFNVVVGEAFSVDIDFIQKTFLYMVFGGYLGIFIWKCV